MALTPAYDGGRYYCGWPAARWEHPHTVYLFGSCGIQHFDGRRAFQLKVFLPCSVYQRMKYKFTLRSHWWVYLLQFVTRLARGVKIWEKRLRRERVVLRLCQIVRLRYQPDKVLQYIYIMGTSQRSFCCPGNIRRRLLRSIFAMHGRHPCQI